MSKALVLGAAALALSVGAASAQVGYPGYDYGGATVPLYGYAGSYGSALQLRGSSLCGTRDGRNDHYYRDAWSGLLSTSGGVRVL